MKKERVIFIDGCLHQGVSQEVAEAVFDEMQAFGTYGYNKSHSYGYAIVAYWCAYLKRYYPREFMTALFQTNAVASVTYTRESRRMGIPVLGPDINESGRTYTLTKSGSIRYGLNSVKFVASGAEALQEFGPFSSMEDFVARIPSRKINKRAAVSLIKCGVFDSLCGDPEKALYQYWKARKDFKGIDGQCKDDCQFCKGSLGRFECYARLEEEIGLRAKHEQELLGTLLSVDPLGDYIDIISEEENFPGEGNMFTGEKATLGGLVTKVNELVTKKGKNPGSKMCQLWLELPVQVSEINDEDIDEDEEIKEQDEAIQVVAFPSAYLKYSSLIEVGSPVLIEVEKLRTGLSLRSLYRLDLLKERV